MNANPHRHILNIDSRSWGVIIEYGDQTRYVNKRFRYSGIINPYAWFMPFEKRVRGAAKAVVRRHDAQSIKAGVRDEKKRAQRERFYAMAEEIKSDWVDA